MNIDDAIKLHGADAVFTAASAGECEVFEPLRAMGLEAYNISDATYIGQMVYDSMSQEEKDLLYREALADDPAAP